MTKQNYSLESEQALIGCLLLDNDCIDKVINISKEHFYSHEHQEIFFEIQKQILNNQKADSFTVSHALRSLINDLLTYLVKIEQNTPGSSNAERYASIIVDKWVKRSIVAILNDGIQSAIDFDENGMVIDLISSRLELLSRQKTDNEPVKFCERLPGYMEILEKRMIGKIKPIATGFVDLDEKLNGGLERGTLTVIAGRPATGKSAFGLSIGRNIASGGSCLFLSMEMSELQVIDRNVAAVGKIPIRLLHHPPEDDTEFWNCLTHAAQVCQNLNFYFDDQTGLNLMQIRSKARKIKRIHGLDAVIIDQLSFITGDRSDKQQWEYIGEYTRGLIQLSKELDIAVILLCQMNRDCERRVDKRPLLSDLAASGSIEQDAATIMMLYRDDLYNQKGMPDSSNCKNKGQVEVSVVKQRQGATGYVVLTYIAEQTRFENFAGFVEPRLYAQRKDSYSHRKSMIKDI